MQLLTTLVLLLGTGPLLEEASAATSGKEVLERYIAALGGRENVQRLSSSVAKGTGRMRLPGAEESWLEFTSTSYVKGEKMREDQKIPALGVEMSVIHDGKTWRMVANGKEAPLPKVMEDMIRSEKSRFTLVQDYLERPFPLQRIDEKPKPEAGGEKLITVLASHGKGLETTLRFDPGTHYLREIEFVGPDPTGRKARFRYVLSEYKPFDRVPTPTKTVVYMEGKPFAEQRLTKVNYTRDIADDLFGRTLNPAE